MFLTLTHNQELTRHHESNRGQRIVPRGPSRTRVVAGSLALAAICFACGNAPSPTPTPNPTPVPWPFPQGDYLGQTPPGTMPVPFAPSLIGNWQHSEVTVSPDGREIYWANQNGIIHTRVQPDGRWAAPAVVSFSGQGGLQGSVPYDDNPVVSPDNRRLFFTSFRPIGYASPNRENIWYVERAGTGWGEPVPMPQHVNSVENLHWQVSVTNDGTVYFGANNKIYLTRSTNGVYGNPEELASINSIGDVMIPFVAPDESYLMFNKVVDGRPSMYISYRQANGTWLTPRVITQLRGGTVFVTRDGRYIFCWFQWVSATILDGYR